MKGDEKQQVKSSLYSDHKAPAKLLFHYDKGY